MGKGCPCPVCGKEGFPECPLYEECKYRKSDLCPRNICWRKPEWCDFYKSQKLAGKITGRTPSSRDFR